MIALLLLVADCIAHALFHVPVLYSVLVYAIYRLLRDEECWYSPGWYVALVCLLLEDFILWGRLGLTFMVLCPLVLLVMLLRHKLFHAKTLLFTGFITLFFMLYDSLINQVVLGHFALNGVTISKILINLVLGYAIFWGTRGNRSLLVKGRKVWTPNRKDAS